MNKEYITYLNEKCKNMVINSSKNKKKAHNIDFIKTYNDCDKLLQYNFNLGMLKQCCKNFKLRVGGNKEELLVRLYAFLYLSKQSIKIQSLIRRKLTNKYIELHGPAFKDKSLCTNETDFLSMEELTNIPYNQFFSFKDEDGFIYGFDIISFNNLIYSSNGVIKNPYNRHNISNETINNLRSLLRLSVILKIDVTTKINNVYDELSVKQCLELRVVTLFQKMDELGNYTNSSWFMNLNIRQLNKLFRELMEVWCYRAPITMDIKQKICPPYGNPFGGYTNHTISTIQNIYELRKVILEVLEKLVFSGIDNDSKCLGAYYILGCLTLVSHEASVALSWLFQAFSYS